ncbi:MAG: NAD(P)H-dependent glycerol-3-phosphate dehydrogenase [Nanobdellota archaeon]
MRKNIAIIGAGSFGTALAKTFSENNNIILISDEKDVVHDINENKENKKHMFGTKLNNNIEASIKISRIKDVDIIIFAIPSSVYTKITKEIKPFYNNQIIISAGKGLDEKGNPLTETIKSTLKCKDKNVFAISGPNIAIEIAEGKTCSTMLGGNEKIASKIKKLFETDNFYIKLTDDIKGIQYLGNYKNMIAILVGLCDGLKTGNNFKSALITKAYRSFYYKNKNKKIKEESFLDYAGIGDLYDTSISVNSRNYKFGKLLSQGKSIEYIKKQIGEVVEGFENIKNMKHYNNDLKSLFNGIIKPENKKLIYNMLKSYLKDNS